MWFDIRSPFAHGPAGVPRALHPPRFALGPSDVLGLHWWGSEAFRFRIIIDVQGRAFVAKTGYPRLQGKTLQVVDSARVGIKTCRPFRMLILLGTTAVGLATAVLLKWWSSNGWERLSKQLRRSMYASEPPDEGARQKHCT